jgi:hypothetical protein
VAAWQDVVDSEPAFAQAARELLDAGVHKTIATLRRDGSPRISGIEAFFVEGELWFGSMWRSRKALDLLRDPRFALHSASADPPAWKGDAKLSGTAHEVADSARVDEVMAASGGQVPPERFHLFRAELAEVVITRLGEPADHLVIELWRKGRPLQRTQRA